MFMILALPRSRTAWLSQFLSYPHCSPAKRVGHDIAIESSSIVDFINRLAKLDGTVETGAMLGWKLARHLAPEIKLVVVRRPLSEVYHSLAMQGVVPQPGDLETRQALLDACAASPGVSELTYEELDSEAVCSELFEGLLGIEWDWEWWNEMRRKNIQVNVGLELARARQNASRLASLKLEVFHAISELQGGAECSGLH